MNIYVFLNDISNEIKNIEFVKRINVSKKALLNMCYLLFFIHNDSLYPQLLEKLIPIKIPPVARY